MAIGCAGQLLDTRTPENITPGGTSISTSTIPTAVATTRGVSPTPAPSPSTPSSSEPTELKYRLIAQFGDPFFCDPDYYPVARQLSDADIEQRFAAIQSNTLAYQTILAHLGLAGQSALSPDEKRTVYAEYKKLNSISLQLEEGKYQFELRIPANQRSGSDIKGQIDSAGNIAVTDKQPTINMCPICLSANSLIATPNGEIPVQDMKEGMPVWTADKSGARRNAVVITTVRRDLTDAVPLVYISLDDGRELFVSPGHPLTDGRVIGDLALGDVLDGARVARLGTLLEKATFDILPSGETGFYWANGILLKSTLGP